VAQGINRFTYVDNRPLHFADVDGYEKKPRVSKAIRTLLRGQNRLFSAHAANAMHMIEKPGLAVNPSNGKPPDQMRSVQGKIAGDLTERDVRRIARNNRVKVDVQQSYGAGKATVDIKGSIWANEQKLTEKAENWKQTESHVAQAKENRDTYAKSRAQPGKGVAAIEYQNVGQELRSSGTRYEQTAKDLNAHAKKVERPARAQATVHTESNDFQRQRFLPDVSAPPPEPEEPRLKLVAFTPLPIMVLEALFPAPTAEEIEQFQKDIAPPSESALRVAGAAGLATALAAQITRRVQQGPIGATVGQSIGIHLSGVRQ
jgi:hypothetical protein